MLSKTVVKFELATYSFICTESTWPCVKLYSIIWPENTERSSGHIFSPQQALNNATAITIGVNSLRVFVLRMGVMFRLTNIIGSLSSKLPTIIVQPPNLLRNGQFFSIP